MAQVNLLIRRIKAIIAALKIPPGINAITYLNHRMVKEYLRPVMMEGYNASRRRIITPYQLDITVGLGPMKATTEITSVSEFIYA